LAIRALRRARVMISAMVYSEHEAARITRPGLVGDSTKQRGPAFLPALVL